MRSAYSTAIFFFSSRRRHTRCSRDWSSDVCSSDLAFPTVVDPDLAPPGMHVMSTQVQYAPYALRRGGWGTEREKLADRGVPILAVHIPRVERFGLDRQILTPPDLEARVRVTEGPIHPRG